MTGLVLIDQPRTGGENMLLDEQMLAAAAQRDRPLLRIYQWSRPTLSLGYFQKYADRLKHAPSCDLDVVRRATGGGAIVHHHDWTYALALPTSALVARGREAPRNGVGASQAVYDCIHLAVVAWLEQLGIDSTLWDNAQPARPTAASCASPCSFLCFERRTTGDVVASSPAIPGQHKVLGSAQRRSQRALLQHGSLLLARSPHAPSLLGLKQLSISEPSGLPNFASRLCSAVTELIGRQFDPARTIEDLLGATLTNGNTQAGGAGKYVVATRVGGR